MSTSITEAPELTLLSLDFEPKQECDYPAPCDRVVQWRATCRFNGCWGMCCTEHMRVLKRQQDFEDTRRGMRCSGCKGAGVELLTFEPIISSDLATLW